MEYTNKELESDNFIVDYDESVSYMPEIVLYLETKTNEIMSFFDLENLKTKKRIVIYTDLEKYKEHIEMYYPYRDYMRADTNDGNINLLSVEEAHKTHEHKDMTVEDLKSTILHEFVHICQQDSEKEHIDSDIVWFWEALATNLGNPENFSRVPIEATNDEINEFNSLENNYSIAFTIGNYLLENFSHKEILDYVKYPSKLLNDSEKILNDVREWSHTKKI